jgi:nucleotide-binding universal stress UspA family protein
LIATAEESRADLIIVGSHGRSALGRGLMGSVSQTLVSHATCSVRVARVPQETMPLRLIVGIDGSPGAAFAGSAVAARHWPPGTQVKLVCIVDRTLATWIGQDAMARTFLGHSTEDLDTNAGIRGAADAVDRELASARLPATTLVDFGDPTHLLVAEAERWGADCIFVGGQGGRVQHLLFGSISHAVAARAHCSVEVVRVVS